MPILDTHEKLTSHLVDSTKRHAVSAQEHIRRKTQKELGQYITPLIISQFMARCFSSNMTTVRLLDVGAGTGILTAAMVVDWLTSESCPNSIACTSIEIDPQLVASLYKTCEILTCMAREYDVNLTTAVVNRDFFDYLSDVTSDEKVMCSSKGNNDYKFTHIIMNPPFKRTNQNKDLKKHLLSQGINSINLYATFLELSVHLLIEEGSLVAIVPRSFLSGPYFLSFRKKFLDMMSLEGIYYIDSSGLSSKEHRLYKDLLILYARKTEHKSKEIEVATFDTNYPYIKRDIRNVTYDSVIHKDDDQLIIVVDKDIKSMRASDKMRELKHSLKDSGLSVSTGKVVDFRLSDHIFQSEEIDSQPLLYPANMDEAQIVWPRAKKGRNSIKVSPETMRYLIPEGCYIIIKRIVTKNSERRIYASIYDPEKVGHGPVGIDNRLNYLHQNGKGIPRKIAVGLCAFLNTTYFDLAFRRINNCNVVNASSLRRMRLPSRDKLEYLGEIFDIPLPQQCDLDTIVSKIVFTIDASI